MSIFQNTVFNKYLKNQNEQVISEKWNIYLPEQQKALEIKAQINQTDKEIDAMVYELYDLTDEEIRIVEGS